MREQPLPPQPQRRNSGQLGGGAATPEVTDARTIKSHINLLRSTVLLKPPAEGEGGRALQFTVDCDLPCALSLFTLCEERGERGGNLRLVWQHRPSGAAPGSAQGVASGAEAIFAQSLEAGSGQVCVTQPLHVEQWPAAQLRPSPCRKKWPIAIWLECQPPSGDQNPTGLPQVQVTYVSLHPETHAARAELQKLQSGREVFVLEDIFGAVTEERAQGGGAESPTAEGGTSADAPAVGELAVEDERTCVVCLTDDRDTLVMPCRHMCLCSGCAAHLRKQMNRCPICRGPIENLLKTAASPG